MRRESRRVNLEPDTTYDRPSRDPAGTLHSEEMMMLMMEVVEVVMMLMMEVLMMEMVEVMVTSKLNLSHLGQA